MIVKKRRQYEPAFMQLYESALVRSIKSLNFAGIFEIKKCTVLHVSITSSHGSPNRRVMRTVNMHIFLKL